MGNTYSSLSENKVRIISEVYLKNKDMLFYYVYSHINNIEEAKDITHDIFLRAIYYNEELKENGIISFLFSIARNLVIDYVRHLNTRLEVDSYIFYVNENIVHWSWSSSSVKPSSPPSLCTLKASIRLLSMISVSAAFSPRREAICCTVSREFCMTSSAFLTTVSLLTVGLVMSANMAPSRRPDSTRKNVTRRNLSL